MQIKTITGNRKPFSTKQTYIEEPISEPDDVQVSMMQTVLAFRKLKRPSSTFKMSLPKVSPDQIVKSRFQTFDRLLPGLSVMGLGQDEMDRSNSVLSHKGSHCRKIFIHSFSGLPPRTIWAQFELTNVVWYYLVNVPTAG
jgi:hypothetical protein